MSDKFDRVILTKDFFHPSNKLEAGVIGTIREILGDTAVIQYNCINGVQNMAGIPLSLLRTATKEDLIKILPSKLLPKNYHIGNRYEINKTIWTIMDINLATNEMHDEIILMNNNEKISALRYKLDEQAMYVPFDEIEKAFTEPEMEFADDKSFIQQTAEPEHPEPPDIVKISIKDFEFSIIDNHIILPSVKKEKINDLIISLNKLQKLFKGDN